MTTQRPYWEALTDNAPTQTKIWLEGYAKETHLSDVSQYHFELISLPQAYDLYLLQGAWGILINRFSNTDDTLYGTGNLGESFFPVRNQFQENDTIQHFLDKQTKQLKQSQKELNTLNVKNEEIHFRYLFLIHTDLNLNKKKINLDPEKYPLLLIYSPVEKNKILLVANQMYYTLDSQKNLAEHFLFILEKILKEPDLPLVQFSILTNSDKEKIYAWGECHLSPIKLNKTTFVDELFLTHVKNTPNHIAITWHGRTISYHELNQLTNKIIFLLAEKKIRSNDNIAVFMDRTPELIAVMLAIFRMGAVFVPINPKYPEERIQFILEDCQANLIIVDQSDTIPKSFLFKTVNINEQLSHIKLNHIPETYTLKEKNLNQLAYIVYTSGTTGQPKGVMIRQISLTNLYEWYQICFQLNPEDQVSQFNSLGFDAFFCEVVPTLAVGANLHIIDDTIKLTPHLFFNWLVENKITICDLPTAYAQVLFGITWPLQSNLRILKIGGESLTHYPKQLPFDVWNIYGPTEATIEATFMKIIQANKSTSEGSQKHTPPPIGKPLLNSACYLVDSHLNLVPVGCAGELLIGGINLSPGYLNLPQLTREKFIENIFSQHSLVEKLYRTGDLARWLPNGNLEFLGRVDHQVKIRGYRVELNEIEAAVSQHSDISEVIVLAKESANGEKTLDAWLVPNLENLRIPWQERGLMCFENETQYFQIFAEDFSKSGIGISGYNEPVEINKKIQINIKLPGANDAEWLVGEVAWHEGNRLGIHFSQNTKQKNLLQKSIEYYLSTHNLMETLQNAASRRSIKQAIKKKLPEYMIPTTFNILPKMPLTFNGKIDCKALPPPQDFNKLLERKFFAPRTETEKTIAKIWEKVLNQPSISLSDNFFDIGGNSLAVSKVLVELMQIYRLTIPTTIFLDLPFIPILAEYIDSKGKSYTKKSNIQAEINRDSILNDDIIPQKTVSPTLKEPKNILLTGAVGFLGLFLLAKLIRYTEAKIYCLIRPGGFDSIASRLQAQIKFFNLENELSLTNRRIVLISADIGLYEFGIPHELYTMLTQKIDCIYHCGAQVNTMASYTTIRTSNVLGTLNIIQFATQLFDKPIYYISTLSAAFEKNEVGEFIEVFPGAQTDQLSGGYAISKWVSERLLTQAMHRGLPVKIYRSGYIGGHSETGITNQNDTLLLLIKGCIQMGYAPDWSENIALLPVDFVAEAIVKLSMDHPSKSMVYHIDHPRGIEWNQLIQWLNKYGYHIQRCSHKEWLNYLEKISEENVLFPFLSYYLSMKNPPNTPPTNMEHTLEILNEIKLAIPEINDTILKTYFNHLLEVGFLPTRPVPEKIQ